jgi:hypothetical protein
MARRRKDFDDLMLELAGITGRTPRFLTQAQIDRIRAEAGSASHETPAERAWREYVEFCGRVQQQLAAVSRTIGNALLKSERRVHAAQEALDSIRERATVDGKGRRVYRTEDQQRAFTEDGQQLSRDEMETVQWRPDAPTWEQHQDARERLRAATEERDQILRYKERADYYAQRMSSGEVLSADELETIQKDLCAMPQAVKAEMEPDYAAGATRMARAGAFGLTEEFTLSAEDLAGIRHDGPADIPAVPRREFAPQP